MHIVSDATLKSTARKGLDNTVIRFRLLGAIITKTLVVDESVVAWVGFVCPNLDIRSTAVRTSARGSDENGL